MKDKLKLKDLGSGHPLPKVFINNDDPPLTHKENTRLRSKAYNLRKENPESNVLIKEGILYHNTVQIDKFDLSNQIFWVFQIVLLKLNAYTGTLMDA